MGVERFEAKLSQYALDMDEEEVWTQRIKQREGGAFFAYARRMWNYSLANLLTPADTKVLRSDFGNAVRLSQGFGFAGLIYWNYVAMSTRTPKAGF